MPTGLDLPIRVTSSGGMATVDGDDNDDKIIGLALASDENENAFQQDIGLGEEMIFGMADATIRGSILVKLRQIFRKFELQKRYKLVEDSILWSSDSDTGDTILDFQYFCIESDEIRTFTKTTANKVGR